MSAESQALARLKINNILYEIELEDLKKQRILSQKLGPFSSASLSFAPASCSVSQDSRGSGQQSIQGQESMNLHYINPLTDLASIASSSSYIALTSSSSMNTLTTDVSDPLYNPLGHLMSDSQ